MDDRPCAENLHTEPADGRPILLKDSAQLSRELARFIAGFADCSARRSAEALLLVDAREPLSAREPLYEVQRKKIPTSETAQTVEARTRLRPGFAHFGPVIDRLCRMTALIRVPLSASPR